MRKCRDTCGVCAEGCPGEERLQKEYAIQNPVLDEERRSAHRGPHGSGEETVPPFVDSCGDLLTSSSQASPSQGNIFADVLDTPDSKGTDGNSHTTVSPNDLDHFIRAVSSKKEKSVPGSATADADDSDKKKIADSEPVITIKDVKLEDQVTAQATEADEVRKESKESKGSDRDAKTDQVTCPKVRSTNFDEKPPDSSPSKRSSHAASASKRSSAAMTSRATTATSGSRSSARRRSRETCAGRSMKTVNFSKALISGRRSELGLQRTLSHVVFDLCKSVCKKRGSLIPRAVPFGLFSTALGIVLLSIRYMTGGDKATELEAWSPPRWLLPFVDIDHPISIYMGGLILGFLCVLRARWATSRYFEGMTNMQFAASKWGDGYCQLTTFIRSSARKHKEQGHGLKSSVVKDLISFQNKMLHWFSMMDALAVNALQAEQLGIDEEVFFHRVKEIRPPEFDVFGKVHHNPHTDEDEDEDDPDREGAPKPSVAARSTKRQLKSRFMGSISVETDDYSSLNEPDHGLSKITIIGHISDHEGQCLRKASNKVNLITGWILEAISVYSLKGAILTEPPILSRIYQELSNGNLGHQQAMKVAIVPFPFPFAQILTWLLVMFLFFAPIIVFVYTGGELLTCGLIFVTTLGFQVIHEIAMELENPFGKSANDLPLVSLHEAWAEMIKEVTCEAMPDYKLNAQFKQKTAWLASPRSEEGEL